MMMDIIKTAVASKQKSKSANPFAKQGMGKPPKNFNIYRRYN